MKIKMPFWKKKPTASERREQLRQALLNGNINYYEEKPEDIIARKAKYKK